MPKTLLIAAVLAALLAGCEKQPASQAMPEVNDTNCKTEAIRKIKDKATREAFAGECAHRSPTGGGIGPTKNPLNWLEHLDQNNPKRQGVKP
jgi:entry exclusion lipoprotein TrbK